MSIAEIIDLKMHVRFIRTRAPHPIAFNGMVNCEDISLELQSRNRRGKIKTAEEFKYNKDNNVYTNVLGHESSLHDEREFEQIGKLTGLFTKKVTGDMEKDICLADHGQSKYNDVAKLQPFHHHTINEL